jgi:hypothetical protein
VKRISHAHDRHTDLDVIPFDFTCTKSSRRTMAIENFWQLCYSVAVEPPAENHAGYHELEDRAPARMFHAVMPNAGRP